MPESLPEKIDYLIDRIARHSELLSRNRTAPKIILRSEAQLIWMLSQELELSARELLALTQ